MLKKDVDILKYGIIFAIIMIFLIIVGDYFFINVELLNDKGAAWYYWKLPSSDLLIRISYWAPYLFHQSIIWFLMFKILKSPYNKEGNLNYYNKAIFILNIIFSIIHLVQTWIFYDGLAQDVPVFTSQGSVIVALVLILIMENFRRGLFFGKKIKIPKKSNSRILKYHGYFMAFAITYTFWFHPMISTQAHIIGFLYIFLFILQLSLTNTPLHRNKYWIFSLEILILIHGTIVALMVKSQIWIMFLTGFGAIFIITQIYGLGLKKFQIFTGSIIYLIIVLYLYTFYPNNKFSISRFENLFQVTWIPIIEYSLVFVISFLIYLAPNFKQKQK